MPIPQIIAFQSGISPLSERLAKLGIVGSETKDKIYTDILSDLGKILVPTLRALTPKGTSGRLAASTSFRIIIGQDEATNETVYRLEIIQDARTSRQFIYRPIVVSGRAAGKMPPALALLGWVQLKWGLSGVEARRGAFRLARHIGVFGTQSNDYVEKAVRDSTDDIRIAANQLGTELIVAISDF